jgi:drug/metabolite transporter (DMT)-like permease
MSVQSFFIVVATVALSAIAQLLLKLGVGSKDVSDAFSCNLPKALYLSMTSPYILSGILVYMGGMGMWLWVLSRVNLSIAYPFVGLSFIFTLILGHLVLHEPVTLQQAIGTVLIAFGCILVGGRAV